MRPIALLFAAHLALFTTAQDKREQARDLAREAVQLMDDGRIAESIKLLEKADKMDPGTHLYLYEIGFAHQLNKDYAKAATYFRKAAKAPDATDQCWQMLGNVYDYAGEPEKADAAYDEGLVAFPNSGRLYMEKAVMATNRKDFEEAIRLHEEGIKADPSYPTNYHRLALHFILNSQNEVWGMIYGELLMNIERHSDRAASTSKLHYDTYKKEITFPTDSTASVSFFSSMAMDVNALLSSGSLKLPFGTMGYEMPLSIAVAGEDSIDLASLDRIRTRFIDGYYDNKLDEEYPNLLFTFQKKVRDAGHMQAYNYWLLRKGNDRAFKAWQAENREAYEVFLEWFRKNPLGVDKEHYFVRTQY
jgi:tetratricopeptide (TPR) repeat protein